MTSPQTLVPEIRFEGFSSAWEQHRLSEFANFSRGNGLSWADVQSDGVNECILYGNLYTDYGMIAESVKYRTNLVPSNPAFSQYGDVLIPGSDTTPTGLARATSIEKTGVLLGGDINILRPNGNVNGSCLSLAINANKSELIKLIKGITVRHIHNDDIKDVEVAFPVAKDEQEKLVGVFKKIDYLINLHQRKQNHLKSVKKSMLEKMFPRDGANVPEIRFAGFTNAWEQRKFSDFALRESSIRLSSSEYPSVEYEDVVAEEGRLNKDVRLKETQKTGIVFEGSQVLYGKLRPYLHNWLNPDFTGVAVGDWWVLRPIGMNKKFLYRLIQTQRFDDVANQSSGSKMPRADWNLLSNTEYIIPSSLDEQRQIAEIFDSLDNLITLHQCKCDKLKEIKNSLLQKMFV